MSYCRWSSDGFKSDVYCYEHCNGSFVIHMASGKIVSELPPEPDIRKVIKKEITTQEYSRRHRIFMDAVGEAERESIGLPHDGETFECETEEEMYDKLRELKWMGYHVPDFVFEMEPQEKQAEVNPKMVTSYSIKTSRAGG